jgi:nitrite reductase/ring-hydroxylating ferredoxin subunit
MSVQTSAPLRPRPRPYGGYELPTSGADEAEITRTDRGTPAGELFRRFWQPFSLTARVTNRPLAIRLLGEDLVAFRDLSGRYGLLHKHCSHRGASLEYGHADARGLRCCYHGWLYDVDGRLLEAPGEPANTPLTRSVCQGAYPVTEYQGILFAYMGPPDERPRFPHLDTFAQAGNDMLPYCLNYPCNWLQVHENQMDPLHAVFLHSRAGANHFTAAWGEMPVVDYAMLRDRMYYVATRRVGDNAWVRLNEVVTPNVGQVAALWETGTTSRGFQRVGITRWTVPQDDTHCQIFGYRHFNPDVEPPGEALGDRTLVGYDSFDIYGQTSGRSYEEMQDNPSDWEAQVSQRPIAAHALEHLGATDAGVTMLRSQLRRAIKGQIDFRQRHGWLSDADHLPTWTGNVVLPWRWAPSQKDSTDERAQLRAIGRKVRDIIIAGDDLPPERRAAEITASLAALASA